MTVPSCFWPPSYFLSHCSLVYSTTEEGADWHHSILERCTLSTHLHVVGPDPVQHLLLQQRPQLEVDLCCRALPSPCQQSMEKTTQMLITDLAFANREGEVTKPHEFGANL